MRTLKRIKQQSTLISCNVSVGTTVLGMHQNVCKKVTILSSKRDRKEKTRMRRSSVRNPMAAAVLSRQSPPKDLTLTPKAATEDAPAHTRLQGLLYLLLASHCLRLLRVSHFSLLFPFAAFGICSAMAMRQGLRRAGGRLLCSLSISVYPY